MENIIEEYLDDAMNWPELNIILRNQYKMVRYTDLGNYNNIESLIGNGIVLFYPVENLNNGHYVSMWIKNNVLYYFDSYGFSIYKTISMSPFLMNLGIEQRMLLPNLIDQWILRNGIVKFNPYKFQELNEDIRTCGRWCSIALLYKLEHDNFKKIFSKYKNILGDKLVVLLTMLFDPDLCPN